MSTERVAIVTGGSSGVGREIVRRITLQGYAVVVAYRSDQAAAEAAVDEILAANGIAVAVRADVSDDLDVERLFAESVEALGGVDVVVHAVGRPAGAPHDAVRALTRAFGRVLRSGTVVVDTVACGPDGTTAAVADVVAVLAGCDGRGPDGHLIEIETRARPGSSTGATPVGRARPSPRGNLRRSR